MREKGKEATDYKDLGLKQTSCVKKFFQNRLSCLALLGSILNKEEKDLEKIGDSTIRAKMTMPKSPIMGKAAISKSSEQEEKESLVSAMVKDIKAEKERGKEQSPPLEKNHSASWC